MPLGVLDTSLSGVEAISISISIVFDTALNRFCWSIYTLLDIIYECIMLIQIIHTCRVEGKVHQTGEPALSRRFMMYFFCIYRYLLLICYDMP